MVFAAYELVTKRIYYGVELSATHFRRRIIPARLFGTSVRQAHNLSDALSIFGCRCGSTAVKYKLTPSLGSVKETTITPDISSLRDAMRERLAMPDRVSFDFYLQRQTDACSDPIEDPTREWQGEYVRVATIVINRQEFLARDQIEFCDALRFRSPAESENEHGALGVMNVVKMV